MTCELKRTAVPLKWQHVISADHTLILAEDVDGDERMTFDGIWFCIERRSPFHGTWQVRYQYAERDRAEDVMMADGGPKPQSPPLQGSLSFQVTGLTSDASSAIREAVTSAKEHWPNLDTRAETRRKHIHSAIKLIRGFIANGYHPTCAAAMIKQDALLHQRGEC